MRLRRLAADGFVCPACGHEKGWARRKARLRVRRLPPADLGKSGRDDPALQVAHAERSVSANRSAWLLAHAAGMVVPRATRCRALVEIDEASLPDPDQRRSSHRGPTQPRRQDARRHETSQAACGWPKSPPRRPRTLRRNRRRSRRHRENRRLVRLRCGPRRSPQCPCRREDRRSPRRQVFSNLKGWARRLRRKHLQAYLDASFASTAAATLLSARSSASPPMQNPLPTAC